MISKTTNSIKKKLVFVFLLFPFCLQAQSENYDIYGYTKYLFSTSKIPLFSKDRLNDHLIHSRINSRWYPTQSLTGALELRLRGFYGGSIKKIPNYKQQIQTDYEYSNLDETLWNSDNSLGYGQVDRLFVDYISGDLQVTIGRQRIAWGTSLVWNITDLFNAKSILDFDYEENPGADALRLQYYTGPVSKIEAVIKPGTSKYSRTFAGLWSINAWNYDFFLIAAVKNNRKVLGGAWAGDIKGAGFRGEFTLSDPPKKGPKSKTPIPSILGKALTSYDKRAFSFVLSGDYTFPNTFYIHTELLYNSTGKKSNAGLFYLQTSEVGLLSPARWSLFQEFSYNISPLIRGSIFGIYNPDDFSRVVLPSINWSAATNLDVMFIGILTGGKNLSEYGNFGNSIYLRMKYSF